MRSRKYARMHSTLHSSPTRFRMTSCKLVARALSHLQSSFAALRSNRVVMIDFRSVIRMYTFHPETAGNPALFFVFYPSLFVMWYESA